MRDRVFLVGDAGGFVDPLTGEGIYGALLSGQAAARAILCESRGEGTAVDAFAASLSDYRQTLRFSVRAAAAFYAEPCPWVSCHAPAICAQVAGQDLYPWAQHQEPGYACCIVAVLTSATVGLAIKADLPSACSGLQESSGDAIRG